MFITLEGCEGSGKTTQAGLLREWFEAQSLEAAFLREPGSTRLGEALRRLLLEPGRPGLVQIEPAAEALLYTAARSQLVQEAIRPALARGGWVVCERYIDSTLAYQGYGLGLPVDELRRINDFATGGLWPRLTVLLDVQVESGLARSQGRLAVPDRIESRALDYHRRVREGYLTLASQEPGRFSVIDAGLRPEDVHVRIVARVEGLLKRGCGR